MGDLNLVIITKLLPFPASLPRARRGVLDEVSEEEVLLPDMTLEVASAKSLS